MAVETRPGGSQAAPAGKTRLKRWLGIGQILISIVLLAWLLNRFGTGNIIAALSELNPLFYALAALVFLVSIAARAVRWYTLLKPLGVEVRIIDLFWLYLLGFFWNSFLPTGFGGDVAKAVALRQATRRGAASATSVLAERAVGLLATSLIGVLVLLFWPGLFPPEAMIVVAGISLSVVAGIAILRMNIPGWLAEHIPPLKPVAGHRSVRLVQDSINTYDLKALGISLLASIPFTLCSILDNYLVGLALGVDLSIWYYAAYTPIISIVGLLPLSFNGLGVREYAYQVLFGMVAVPPEQAVAMALAFNLLRFAAGLLGGIVSFAGGIRQAVDTNTGPIEAGSSPESQSSAKS